MLPSLRAEWKESQLLHIVICLPYMQPLAQTRINRHSKLILMKRKLLNTEKELRKKRLVISEPMPCLPIFLNIMMTEKK